MLCIYENCEYQVNKLNNESHCVAIVLLVLIYCCIALFCVFLSVVYIPFDRLCEGDNMLETH